MKINKCPQCKAVDKPVCVQAWELKNELLNIKASIDEVLKQIG